MGKRIAIAGCAVLDHYKTIDMYPEHSTLTTVRERWHEVGGALCNCAIDLARLDPDLNIKAIGRVGDDDNGRIVCDTLMKYENIDVSGVISSGQSSFTDVMIDISHQTRTFFHFRGANALLDIEDFRLYELEADLLHVGYLLLLDRLDAMDPEFGTRMARLLADAQRLGIKISIDVVSENSDRFQKIVLPALPFTDYCLMNEYEAEKTTGIRLRDLNNQLQTDKVQQACEQLFSFGVRHWVVIHAREGAVGVSRDGECVRVPALDVPKERIVSTTGAGDALVSGVLYGALHDYNLLDAVRLGIATATRSLLADNANDGVIPLKQMNDWLATCKYEQWPGFMVSDTKDVRHQR